MSPETKYNRAKIIFAVTRIALTLKILGTKLLQLPVQSVWGVPVPSSQAEARINFAQAFVESNFGGLTPQENPAKNPIYRESQ